MSNEHGPILVLGADGYTGWPITCRLLDAGYNVIGVDSYDGRDYRGESVIPISGPTDRLVTAQSAYDGHLKSVSGDVTNYQWLVNTISNHDPATVVNVAQIPAAPYSMASIDNAWNVQQNNIRGSLNLLWALKNTDNTDIHVVQLATMGEYPLGNDIPEGWTKNAQPAPKRPGSLYHASKVNTTVNTLFLSETWDVPVTEVYQGIIFGVETEALRKIESLNTRFDVDAEFGTVVNRFTAQAAVDHPLTVYGEGGQKRAMLPLQQCVDCIQRLIETPPAPDAPGTYPYRPVNQFDDAWRVNEVAEMVASQTGADIMHIENPRDEDETDHEYNPHRRVLDELGYEPTGDLTGEFERTYPIVKKYNDRIDRSELSPDIAWDST